MDGISLTCNGWLLRRLGWMLLSFVCITPCTYLADPDPRPLRQWGDATPPISTKELVMDWCCAVLWFFKEPSLLSILKKPKSKNRSDKLQRTNTPYMKEPPPTLVRTKKEEVILRTRALGEPRSWALDLKSSFWGPYTKKRIGSNFHSKWTPAISFKRTEKTLRIRPHPPNIAQNLLKKSSWKKVEISPFHSFQVLIPTSMWSMQWLMVHSHLMLSQC
jgi:hypothetical protein